MIRAGGAGGPSRAARIEGDGCRSHPGALPDLRRLPVGGLRVLPARPWLSTVDTAQWEEAQGWTRCPWKPEFTSGSRGGFPHPSGNDL